MSSLNKVFLLGRLGRDPEVRFLGSGTAMCSLSVATDRSWKDKKTDDWKKETTGSNVQVGGKTAERGGESLAKGSTVHVEGRISVREYEKDGQKKKAFEIVADSVTFMDPRGSGGAPTDRRPQTGMIPDDDIPF